jgi:hypothetical protein
MTGSSEEVRCTVEDGEVSMRLDDVHWHIPLGLLKKSKIVMDVLSSMSDSSFKRHFTLAAPKEWLHAWVSCYVSKVEHLANADTEVLVNCVKVCLCH